MLQKHIFCFLVGLLPCLLSYCQAPDKETGTLLDLPSGFLNSIQNKATGLDKRLSKQAARYVQRMARQEEALRKRLSKVDSSAAKKLFTDPAYYTRQVQKLTADTGSGAVAMPRSYLPVVDSLNTGLSFLMKNKQLLSSSKDVQDKLQLSASQIRQLQSRMANAEEIEHYVRERKVQIKEALSHYTGLPGNLKSAYAGYLRTANDYSSQLKQYREELNDPDKLQQRALALLGNIPAFKDFFSTHSQLASLFNLPGSNGPEGPAIPGLQTRDQVATMIQGQVAAGGAGGQEALQQNLQAGQAKLDEVKAKLNTLGNGGDDDMPGQRPDNPRSKPFLKRLEYSANIQTARSTNFFPVTTDLGGAIGYKLDHNSTIGVGMSYKLGWGKDFSHIALSTQGIGLRTFLDLRIKGDFYLSGGYELNDQPAVVPVTVSGKYSIADWQRSGLLGVSKAMPASGKLIKRTKLQLLWDFLSYSQVPRTQPLKVRIGYTF